MNNNIKKLIAAAGIMLPAFFSCALPLEASNAQSRGLSDNYKPVTEITGNAGDYIAVSKQGGSIYTVKAGDCLWQIAHRELGSGSRYKEIARQNQLADPDFILPGQELLLGDEQTLYIPRQKGSLGGMEFRGTFQFDFPTNFVMGTTSLDTELSSLHPRGSDTEILFNIAQNDREKNAFSDSWEEFCDHMRQRQEEILGETAKEPVFERYALENGDELYFFYFELEDTKGEQWTEAVGYRLCEDIQAEFIGLSPEYDNYPIEDVVRYMTASFEEQQGDDHEKFSMWGNGGHHYMAEENWDYAGFHNAFAVGYRKLTGKQWKAEGQYTHIAPEKDFVVEWENSVVELAVRKYLGVGTKEPLYASDLEDITYIGLVVWAPMDVITINDESYECSFSEIWESVQGQTDYPAHFGALAIEDLKNFINLEGLTLSLSDLESYENLGELSGLKQLNLSRDIHDRSGQIEDISFLGKMEGLEELHLEDAFDTILDWSVLENCPNLKRIELETNADGELIFPEGVEVISS